MRALVAIAIVTATLVFVVSRGGYYALTYGSESVYSRAHVFGDECEAVVVQSSRSEPLARALETARASKDWAPYLLPGRRNPPAERLRATAEQAIVTRCRVDLGLIAESSFGVMSLGPLYGDAAVYLDGTLRLTQDDAGVARIPLLPEDRHAAVLEVVARTTGADAGRVGLSSLIPLVFTGQRADVAMIDVMTLLQPILRPLYWLNMSLAFAFVLALAWIGGIRSPHVGWALLVVTFDALANLITISPDQVIRLAQTTPAAFLSLGIYLAAAAACATAARPEAAPRLAPLFTGALAAYGVILSFVYWSAEHVSWLTFVRLELRWYVQLAGFTAAALYGLHVLWAMRSGSRWRVALPTAVAGLFAVAQVANLATSGIWAYPPSLPLTEVATLATVGLVVADLVLWRARFLEKTLETERLERDKERLGAIGRTAQGIAHDLRRPFALARATIGAKESRLAERHRKELEASFEDAEMMLEELMRLDAPTLVQPRPESLAGIVQAAAARTFSQREDAAVKVRYDLRHERLVSVDAPKIRRAVINVLDNARQAMGSKGGSMHVASRDVSLDGRAFVELTLRNTNSFIPEAERAAVFELFYTKGKRGGTGLGLAVVRSVVEAHGGRVACDADEAEGVTFTFLLPAAEGNESGASVAPEPSVRVATVAESPAPRRDDARRTVAVVEDDPFLIDLWTEAPLDCAVLVYESPGAFRAAVDADPALLRRLAGVVSDYYFDGADETGDALARWLKARRPELPVALASNGRFDASTLAAFDAVVEKEPMDLARLERAWSRSQVRAASRGGSG